MKHLLCFILFCFCSIATADPGRISEVERLAVKPSLQAKWRTASETYELSYDPTKGAIFRINNLEMGLYEHYGPFYATSAILSEEKDSLLIVLKSKNRQGALKFRGFIRIGPVNDQGQSGEIITPYLDIATHNWNPDIDSIVSYQSSLNKITVKPEDLQGATEQAKPPRVEYLLDDVKWRTKPDKARMLRELNLDGQKR